MVKLPSKTNNLRLTSGRTKVAAPTGTGGGNLPSESSSVSLPLTGSVTVSDKNQINCVHVDSKTSSKPTGVVTPKPQRKQQRVKKYIPVPNSFIPENIVKSGSVLPNSPKKDSKHPVNKQETTKTKNEVKKVPKKGPGSKVSNSHPNKSSKGKDREKVQTPQSLGEQKPPKTIGEVFKQIKEDKTRKRKLEEASKFPVPPVKFTDIDLTPYEQPKMKYVNDMFKDFNLEEFSQGKLGSPVFDFNGQENPFGNDKEIEHKKKSIKNSHQHLKPSESSESHGKPTTKPLSIREPIKNLKILSPRQANAGNDKDGPKSKISQSPRSELKSKFVVLLKEPLKFTFQYNLTKPEQDKLSNEYKHIKITFTNQANHTHAFAKFESQLSIANIVNGVRKDLSIIDVGADPNLGLYYSKDHKWHAMSPLLTPGDVDRKQKFDTRFNLLKLSDKATSTSTVKNMTTCEHLAETCYCLLGNHYDLAISIHSIYYLTKEDIGKIIFNTKSKQLYAVLHLFPYTSGTLCQDLNYVTEDDGTITTRTKELKDTVYNHPNVDWLHETACCSTSHGTFTWNCQKKIGDTYIYRFFETPVQLANPQKIVTADSGYEFYTILGETYYKSKQGRSIRMPSNIIDRHKSKITFKARTEGILINLTNDLRKDLVQVGSTDARDLAAMTDYVAFSGMNEETSQRQKSIGDDLPTRMKEHQESLKLQSTVKMSIKQFVLTKSLDILFSVGGAYCLHSLLQETQAVSDKNRTRIVGVVFAIDVVGAFFRNTFNFILKGSWIYSKKY